MSPRPSRVSTAEQPRAEPRSTQGPEGNGCGLLVLRLGRASATRLGSALAALEMRPHEFAVLNGLA